MKKALKTDWNIKPFPKDYTTLEYQKSYSLEEYDKLRYGCVPAQMEDKWFIYFEDNKLYFHRSWTGICVYIVEFLISEDRVEVSNTKVNRSKEEHTDEEVESKDVEILTYLIDHVLLKKEVELPFENPLENWSVLGRDME